MQICQLLQLGPTPSFEKKEKISIAKDVKRHNAKVKFLKLIERLNTYYLFNYDKMSPAQKSLFYERVDMVQSIIDRNPLKADKEEKIKLNKIWNDYKVTKLEGAIFNAPLGEYWPYKDNIFFRFDERDDKTFRYELKKNLSSTNSDFGQGTGYVSLADAKNALYKKILEQSGNL